MIDKSKENKLNLLAESILAWKEKLTRAKRGWKIECGPEVCPLCAEFYDTMYCCRSCPIYGYTGVRFCDVTPYYRVLEVKDLQRDNPLLIKAIESEIEFLKKVYNKLNKRGANG